MVNYSWKEEGNLVRSFISENKINLVLIIITFIGITVLFAFPQASYAVKKGTTASRDKWREIARRKAKKRLSENIPLDKPVILPKTIDLDSAVFLAVLGGLLFSTFTNKE